MPVIRVRVDEDTWGAMRRVRDVNWSEVVRGAIRDRADRELRENKVKALVTFEELSRKPRNGFDSTKAIRYWRDRRYGPMRGRR